MERLEEKGSLKPCFYWFAICVPLRFLAQGILQLRFSTRPCTWKAWPQLQRLRAYRPRLWPWLSRRWIAVADRCTRASTRIPLFTTRRDGWSRTTSSPASETVLPNWPAPSHVAKHASPRARHLLFYTSFQPEAHPNRYVQADPSLAESEINIQHRAIHHQIKLFNRNTRDEGDVMHKGGNRGVHRISHSQRLARQVSDKETPFV